MLLQYINKCLCWGRSMWAQWLNSNSLFWSAPERLEDLRHLRANYEKHTQAIFFLRSVPRASLRKQKHWHLRNGKGRGVSWIQHNDDNVPQGFSVVLSQGRKDSRQTRENIYLYLSGSWAYNRLSSVIKICKCINAIPLGDYNMRQLGLMACANGLKLRAICLFPLWIFWICVCDWRVSAYILW